MQRQRDPDLRRSKPAVGVRRRPLHAAGNPAARGPLRFDRLHYRGPRPRSVGVLLHKRGNDCTAVRPDMRHRRIFVRRSRVCNRVLLRQPTEQPDCFRARLSVQHEVPGQSADVLWWLQPPGGLSQEQLAGYVGFSDLNLGAIVTRYMATYAK